MEMESAKWLAEQDLEEYNFIQQYLKESLSSESYSSYPCSVAPAVSNSSIETPQPAASQRPNKLQKTSSWSSTVTADHQSPKISPSHILSFNFDSHQPYKNLDSTIKPIKEEAVSPTGTVLNSSKSYKRSHSIIRTPSHAQDHILAERKRREKLSQRFIALSALVPGLKKMDKATVLGDAIKYVKQLQERVKVLEEQTRKRSIESVVLVKKSHVSVADDDNDDDDSSSSNENSALLEIEAKVSEKDVLIRVHCNKQPGLVPKILNQIENLHLSIINTTVLPFGNSILDITVIAQMDAEFSMAVKDLVKNLRLSFDNFM